MTVEDFEKRQAAMSDKELIELAHKEVSELCKTGGRSLRMCVPPMITDTDMVLCEVIKRFERLSNPINNDLHIPDVSVAVCERCGKPKDANYELCWECINECAVKHTER